MMGNQNGESSGITFSFETKLKKVLNKAYLKKPVTEEELLRFREELLRFTDLVDPNQPEQAALA